MDKTQEAFEKLNKQVEFLRKNCHWDKKQTIQSYVKNLVDEANEAAEAVENNDADEFREELGDAMWNILFLANIAKEKGLFDINEILEKANEKMIRRHPHVFVKKTNDETETWEMYNEVKKKEKEQKAKRQIRHIHKPLKGVKAIIFDWDGVIIDSLPLAFVVYTELEKQLGKKIMPEMHGDYFELDWREHFKRSNLMTEENIKLAEDLYIKKSIELNIPAVKGMVETIKKLKQNNPKLKFSIASNNYKENICRKLNEFGITEMFPFIFDGRSLKNKKPHPEQIIKCLEGLNVKPEEAVFIGDMDGDIVAGKAAGVKTVAVTFGYHSLNRIQKENPDYIIGMPEELLHIIQ